MLLLESQEEATRAELGPQASLENARKSKTEPLNERFDVLQERALKSLLLFPVGEFLSMSCFFFGVLMSMCGIPLFGSILLALFFGNSRVGSIAFEVSGQILLCRAIWQAMLRHLGTFSDSCQGDSPGSFVLVEIYRCTIG